MPPIQIPINDTLETLQNVLKRRAEAHQELFERKALSGGDYRQLEEKYDRTSFIQPEDAATTKASIYYTRRKWTRYCAHKGLGSWQSALHAETCTKGKMMGFLRWICDEYILPKKLRGKKGRRKSVNQYWRDFKMLYRRANGSFVNANDSYEVVKYINSELKRDYGLDDMPKPKPLAGKDTLLLLLTHHWARDESIYRTEDDRLDVATITLFLAYTGARPAEFVHTSKSTASQDPLGKLETSNPRYPESSELDIAAGDCFEFEDDSDVDDEDLFDGDQDFDSDQDLFDYDKLHAESTLDEPADAHNILDSEHSSDRGLDELSNLIPEGVNGPRVVEPQEIQNWKLLCYEDISLWIVQNPKPGGRDVLAMEVLLRHHKGADKKPKPTIFLLRENVFPILCPISHVVARAIRDDAVLVDGYTSAEPFLSTNLRRLGKKAMRVNWKPEWLKRPLFRKSVLVAGQWVKSKTEPMLYSQFNFYLQRDGRDAGLEEIVTSYCFRRAAINAADGVASDAKRDQMARHDPGRGVFNGSYLNERFDFNSQAAYLEEDVSEDGLTRAFAHMSLRCHPGAPSGVPPDLLHPLLAADPVIISLARKFDALRHEIKMKYRFIKHAPKGKRHEHKLLQQQLKNAKKSLTDDLDAAYRKDYFYRVHNEMMKMSLKQAIIDSEPGSEPMVKHELEERNQLQGVLCDFSRNLSSLEIVSRKITAIDRLVALASRRMCQTRQRRQPPSTCKDPMKLECASPAALSSPQLDQFAIVCEKTQCIVCLGDTRLSCKERTRKFSRVSHMMTHVENCHLQTLLPNERPFCQHPYCSPEGKGLFFDSIMLFKNHVARIHKINLRV